MKRLKKKILGILLSIVMVLGLMPGMSLVTDAANSVTDSISTVVPDEPQGVGHTFHGPHCDITATCTNENYGIFLGGDTAVFAAHQGFVITEISFNNSTNLGGVLTTTAGNVNVTPNGITYTISGINRNTVTLDATGQAISFTSVNVTLSEENNNSGSDSSSSSGHHHHKCENGHIFSFQVLEAATTEKDGVGMWCCERCGIPDWNEHENAAPGEKVVISAYTVFNDTLENNMKAAESGATVSITTSRWVSVRRGVLEALAEKPGVTLTVNFEYQGMGYVIAIPGGDPALAGILASEDRFFGLMNLGNTYGLTAVEK